MKTLFLLTVLGVCIVPATWLLMREKVTAEAVYMKAQEPYHEALAKAKESKKPLLIVFGATWCGPCRSMEANTFANEAVKKELEAYVVIHIDVDKDGILMMQLLPGERSIPAYCVLDTDTYTKVTKHGVGYQKADTFVEWLRTEAKP